MATFAVILPMAGGSTRFGGPEKKPFLDLMGRAVWLRAAECFIGRPGVTQILAVVSEEDEELFLRRYSATVAFMGVELVRGGAERFESVANALARVTDAEFVAVHDAVRPCLKPAQVDAVFAAAQEVGAALLAAPLADTLKRGDNQRVTGTVPRDGLWLAQTPQVARTDWLREAYSKRGSVTGTITDDAQLLEAAGYPVALVESDVSNFKITRPSDLALAAVLLGLSEAPTKRPLHPFADIEDG